MAREQITPSVLYTPGRYNLPVLTGGFSRENSSYLEVLMTAAAWPTGSPLFTLSVQWDDREPTVWTVAGSGGHSIARFRVSCRNQSGTDILSKMTVVLNVNVTITTAITARVV